MNFRENDQVWYHLSKTKWKAEAITSLRQTKKGHGEPKRKRLSLAPTVGRALLGCPHPADRYFIYNVQVKNPEEVTGTDTRDHHVVHEYLVTEEVLAREGGVIPMRLVGEVLVDEETVIGLKSLLMVRQLNLPSELEDEILWEVQGGIWTYRKLAGYEVEAELKRRLAGGGPEARKSSPSTGPKLWAPEW